MHEGQAGTHFLMSLQFSSDPHSYFVDHIRGDVSITTHSQNVRFGYLSHGQVGIQFPYNSNALVCTSSTC